MASVIHDPKARATLLLMAQVWLRLAGQGEFQDAEGADAGQGRRVRGFSVRLGGELVPGPSHVLHDLAMPLGLGVSRQPAAFLRNLRHSVAVSMPE